MRETKAERRARKDKAAQEAFTKRQSAAQERQAHQRTQEAQPATQSDLDRLLATYNQQK